MAAHTTVASLLKESLPEFLVAARYCVEFHKDAAWGEKQLGGCLGYPAAALLFSIADSLGAYGRDLSVPIDGKSTKIGSETFRVFNAQFYSLSLSGRVIKKLYANYRNLLLHNAALAADHVLFSDKSASEPFPEHADKVHVNVSAFLSVTSEAVNRFLLQAHAIVPGSRAEADIHAKK